MYTGNAFLGQYFNIPIRFRIIISIIVWLFAIFMIHLYAPADTENVPIVSKKERRKRKNISYVIATIMLVIGCIIDNNMVSNILLVGVILQTFAITRLAYKITNNKYGYEEYLEN